MESIGLALQGKHLVKARAALVIHMMLVANVKIIIAIDARAYDAWRAHHGAAASHHPRHYICLRNVLLEKELPCRADFLVGNGVIGERQTRIRCAGRLARRNHMEGS